jgi:hypothetical protein
VAGRKRLQSATAPPYETFMRIDLIPAGDNPPESINVLIEVPIGGEPGEI